MKPPSPFSRSLVTMRFSRWRSSSELILRDTPTWFTVGMYTRKRPGSAMWLVMRAPFLAMGSLAIWIRISWPSLSNSVISGCGRCALARTIVAAARGNCARHGGHGHLRHCAASAAADSRLSATPRALRRVRCLPLRRVFVFFRSSSPAANRVSPRISAATTSSSSTSATLGIQRSE